MIKLLKFFALAAVIYVLVLPLRSANFGITPGLFVAGSIFLVYAILGFFGVVLKRQNGNRFGVIDVILIGLFPLYLIYFGNERFLSSIDTLATRQLPVAILTKGTLDLSQQKVFSGKGSSYAVIMINGKKLSAFPIGTAILALPHTAIASAISGTDGSGWESLRWEKHFAALTAALTALLLFFTVRMRLGESIALKTAAVFALGTNLFSCASQAMWSFTGELFFLTLALFLLAKSSSGKLAGIAAGAAFLCRPTAILFVAIAVAFLYSRDKKMSRTFLGSSFVSILVCIAILWSIYGHPLGGYGMMNLDSTETWQANFPEALAGNLFSPSRGLLIYFPFLLVCFFVKPRNAISIWSIVSITLVVLITSFYSKWWGGHSLGPRLLTETSLFLALLTIPVWLEWRKPGWQRFLFAVLLLFSIFTQFLLVYNPAAAEWSGTVQIDAHPEMLWSWPESQLIAAWVY